MASGYAESADGIGNPCGRKHSFFLSIILISFLITVTRAYVDSSHVSCADDVDSSRQPLKLDIHTSFCDEEVVLQNVLTHSTSPGAYLNICRSGECQGSVSDVVRYDGFPADDHPPCAFFMANPSSDGTIFPCSIYPRDLEEGAATKIMLLEASILSQDQFRTFYVASTPTHFGQEFKRVYQTHVMAVRKDDTRNLERANNLYTSFDVRTRNSLLYFDDDKLFVATRVRVSGSTYVNTVMVSFCNGLKFSPSNMTCIDGTKIVFRNKRVSCPWEQCTIRCVSISALKTHFRAVHLGIKMFSCSLCKRSFSRNSHLKNHMTRVHDKENPKNLVDSPQYSSWKISKPE